MLNIISVWDPPGTDLETRNQVKVVCLGGEGQPETGGGGGGEHRVARQEGEGASKAV